MTRTLMRYDPNVGMLYTPNLKMRVAGEKGGYLVRTNAAGFRSEREFIPERTPQKFRAVLFGDSQTAGDGVPNKQRFSDLLEQNIADLEVYNYGISGTGTDQHLLAFDKHCNVEHDLVIIALYVENIRRISRRVIGFQDENGIKQYRPKPYFELLNGNLEIRNIPVPKKLWTEQALPDEYRGYIYDFTETNLIPHLTGSKLFDFRSPPFLKPVRKFLKAALLRNPALRMLPEYNNSHSPGWVLLRAILERWLDASKAPILIVTIPHAISFNSFRDPTSYRARFRELAGETRLRYYDFFSDLNKVSKNDRRLLWSEWSGHLTAPAHNLLAEGLTPVIQSLMRDAGATPKYG